jgi:hypothetical protein
MKARPTSSFLTVASLLLTAFTNMALVEAESDTNYVTIIATNPPAADPAPLPRIALQPVGIVKEVEKLVASGTDAAVVKAFILSWPTPYSISADDILQLQQLGVSTDIINTLLQRQSELNAQAPVADNPDQEVDASNAPAPYPGSSSPLPLPLSPPPPIPDQSGADSTYPAEVPVTPGYQDDSGYYPAPYPGVVVVGGVVFAAHPGHRVGFGGHGLGHHEGVGHGATGGMNGHEGGTGYGGGSGGGRSGGNVGHGSVGGSSGGHSSGGGGRR